MFPSPVFHQIVQNVSLDDWVKSNLSPDYDLPFLVELGCVYLNHKRIAPKLPTEVFLKPDDVLRIHPRPRRYPKPFVHFQELIVGETVDFWVIDKPAGVPVHPTLDNLHENLLRWGTSDLGKPLFITHRLDVGTSGLMVYAKHAGAQARFNKYLKENRVRKVYRAVGQNISPNVPLPTLEPWIHWMVPSPRAPKEVRALEFETGIRCESRPLKIEPQYLGNSKREVVVDLELVTGRTHQIRAQMSALGWPIVGDKMYGSLTENNSTEPDGVDQWKLRCIDISFPEFTRGAH